MFGGSHQQLDDATTNCDATQLDNAFQPHSALCLLGQHKSSHDQIHNHTTLSNPQDCPLQLHWVCVACSNVQ